MYNQCPISVTAVPQARKASLARFLEKRKERWVLTKRRMKDTCFKFHFDLNAQIYLRIINKYTLDGKPKQGPAGM